LASSAANWPTSVGSPAAAFFHAALGVICLYYNSTFAPLPWQSIQHSPQLIDASNIAQNEIDVTSIDGNLALSAKIEGFKSRESIAFL
jgi:hypothetical protein